MKSVSASIYRYYNGLIKKAQLATGGTDDTLVVSTPITLTAVNIQAELLRGFVLIPAALKYNPKMKIFCSYATYDLYIQSQIAQTYKGADITTNGNATFRGLPVVKIADFPDNSGYRRTFEKNNR